MNPLYLFLHITQGFVEEKEGGKYLNITSTDSNSEISKKYEEVQSRTKDCIEKINDGISGEYGKDYIKINFNSNDDLPLNKQLKLLNIKIIARSVFEQSGKYYPEIFLDDCLYEV